MKIRIARAITRSTDQFQYTRHVIKKIMECALHCTSVELID